jgi:putative ABC transport system ATP-binding protein
LYAAFESFSGSDTTLIYFSNRPEDMTLDGFLWLGRESQQVVADRAVFDRLRRASGEEVSDGNQR